MAKSRYLCQTSAVNNFGGSKLNPNYKGKVGQGVLDLGIILRTHTQSSLNKGKRVSDTAKVVKRAQALALAVRDKVNIINTAGQSKAIYGAAVYSFTQAEINALRSRFSEARWPNKYTACRTTGLLLVDKGEIEPGVTIVKQVLVNWLRQVEGGLALGVEENWEKYDIHTRQVRGPMNYSRRIIKQLKLY
eukprot:2296970-Heterocapsa_arctica.AAC.1